MLSSPNTVLRFIMHCIIWFPQPPYEIYVRKCEGTEILFHLPTNKLARHRLMVEDTDSWIRDNKLLTTETKASVSIYTGSVSLDFCRAVQGGPSDSWVILEDRHSKFRKAQSLKGALSKPANFLPWREILWLFFWTAKGGLYLDFPRLFAMQTFLKRSFWTKCCQDLHSQDMQKYERPMEHCLPTMIYYSRFYETKVLRPQVTWSGTGICIRTSFQWSKCRGKFIVLPSSW